MIDGPTVDDTAPAMPDRMAWNLYIAAAPDCGAARARVGEALVAGVAFAF